MFKVGQKVWDVAFGAGVVTHIENDNSYSVVVNFASLGAITYTKEGRSCIVHENPTLYPYPVEIIRKITKPSINWEHVQKDFKFLAQDIDGNAYLYWEKPVLRGTGWQTTQGDFAEAQSYASYTPGTCDWQYSLVERP